MKENVLIIGSGSMAIEYIKALKKNFSEVSISIVGSSNKRNIDIKSAYNINKTYLSLDQVMVEDFTKCIVCTSENKFLEIARFLSNYKIEVLFEKPLGTNLQETTEIIALSNNNFYLALNRRFYEGISELKEFINKLDIKHMLILDQQSSLDWSKRRLSDVKGDIVFNNSVHIIDLAFYLIGSLPGYKEIKIHKHSTSSVSKYFMKHKDEFYIDYIRHNEIPGKWQIVIFAKDHVIYFHNLERFDVFDSNRNIIFSSKPYESSIKQGIEKMLDSFINKRFLDPSKLLTVEKSINLFKFVDKIR